MSPQYDAARYSAANPIYPFVETSCMDGAPPFVGDGPCCSKKRRANFTPTLDEERRSTRAKLESTQVRGEEGRSAGRRVWVCVWGVSGVFVWEQGCRFREVCDNHQHLHVCLDGRRQ